ncbi:50S ribosomal protein L6 ['Camptotheca acuminata' phytoplasma]|uniref:50S ribosomal protein L6 n=1 Tax='Camptotheca acuminata' phytoplasma TaxID=3239192 RepID=UPI003519E73A
MSRVGRKLISIPEGVQIEIQEKNLVNIKYNTNQLQYQFNPLLNIDVKDGFIKVSRTSNDIFTKKIHGTTRALLSNIIAGLIKPFIKRIEIVGLGYDVTKKNSDLVFNLGFSHIIPLTIPSNLEIEIIKNKEIIVKGIDKQFVGEFAAKILKLRKPEPYKGKGIRLFNQYVHRKAGKSAKK